MQLNSAMKCAKRAHRGQVDKSGKDYIGHPGRVAKMVKPFGEDFEIVAWCHDVIEDTDFFKLSPLPGIATDELIESWSFTEAQALALIAITRYPHETYRQYIERVRGNFIARVVKIADVRDNLSPERLFQLPERQQRSLSDRYNRSLIYLTGEGNWASGA